MEQKTYKGHNIKVRARDIGDLGALKVEREPEQDLLIDDKPVRFGRLPDGSYYLNEYAYDWGDNLMKLAEKFIDYQYRQDKIRRQAGSPRGN